MSNLYEILEVSEKASKEIIEKAYRVLAKKYHPDLQKQEEKQNAEKKMKQINEAYDILSDEIKRREYDKKLVEERKKQSQQRQMEENEIRNRNEKEHEKQEENRSSYQNIRNIQKEMNQAYSQAYRNYVRSLGYRVKEPWTWKRVINLLKALGIIGIIILVLWLFPPTNQLMINFYETNVIVKTIIDIVIQIGQGIWEGMKTFFSELF